MEQQSNENRLKEPDASKVALVTGGATGIGRAVAERLLAEGLRVVIASRNRARGRAVAQAYSRDGGEATFIQTDVRRATDVRALLQQIRDAYGRLDCVCNNAAVEGIKEPLHQWPESAFEEVVETNVKGILLVMKRAIPLLIEQETGVIVNTSSFVGTVAAVPTSIVYGGTKAAVMSMTASTAAAYGGSGIRCYALCPWITDTSMIDRISGGEPAVKEQLAGLNPSGQMVEPVEVARVVARLFGGGAGYDNGSALLIDSGGTVRPVDFPVPLQEAARRT